MDLSVGLGSALVDEQFDRYPSSGPRGRRWVIKKNLEEEADAIHGTSHHLSGGSWAPALTMFGQLTGQGPAADHC